VSNTEQPTGGTAVDYVVIGIALCHQKNAEGKTDLVHVAEPIPATALEAMAKGIRTSFEKIYATTWTRLFPDGALAFPIDVLDDEACLCHDFEGRTRAAMRTYQAKPELRVLPLGATSTPQAGPFRLNYDPGFRRVLGGERVVRDSDNVRQHAHTHQVLI